MKKKLSFSLLFLLLLLSFAIINNRQKTQKDSVKIARKVINPTKKGKKKTLEERALYNEARELHEYYRQVNPNTGKIPKTEKARELKLARKSKSSKNRAFAKIPDNSYVSRGPSNFGGRTRTVVIDRSDNSGNTMIAGGVSGGVFRTTNGGNSWVKVSENDEIHNVTSIVQDPRAGFENTWYYATGEGLGNSASFSKAFYLGQGIWKSTNGGLTWFQMPSTDSTYENYDSFFDVVFKLEVHPLTGDLFAAVAGQIRRFDVGTSTWNIALRHRFPSSHKATDVLITSGGRVYASFSGACNLSNCDPATTGVWTSPNGQGNWSRISDAYFSPQGRVALALAPSNENKLYTLFDNGKSSDCDTNPEIEADLWLWDQSTETYTDYSNKLPDETGCSNGNDPFTTQRGYDIAISVKPDNENFVVIGGTNAYKIEDITTDSGFIRIGGYAGANTYEVYINHHPDVHTLVFSPFDNKVLVSGTDGGLHKTNDITASKVAWGSLNNNYQTFQYYHVGIDPSEGSNGVIGGSQDNGTVYGGSDLDSKLSDLTTQISFFGGDGGASAISRDIFCVPLFLSTQNGKIYRDCLTLREITPEVIPDVPYDSKMITYFHLDPDNNNALYYAAKNRLLRTTDATNVSSNTWDDLGNTTMSFGHDDEFTTFSTTWGAYNPATSYLLMGGDSGHIYRLDDPQNATNISSAIDITPTDASTSFPSIVTGLAIHPTNKDIVLATYSNYGINSIFLTTNATTSTPDWTLVERNLSSHSIRSAAIVNAMGQTIYFVGTARGLYSSSNPETTDWQIESTDKIGFAVVSSLALRPSDNHLLIGTHGNGMFEATINNVLGTKESTDISNEVSVYPNPVENEINVKTPSKYDNAMGYNIINISGQSVSRGLTKNKKIDVSGLSAGVYFVLLNAEGANATKKVIKK